MSSLFWLLVFLFVFGLFVYFSCWLVAAQQQPSNTSPTHTPQYTTNTPPFTHTQNKTKPSDDVREARSWLDSVGMSSTRLLAKVETRQALLNYRCAMMID